MSKRSADRQARPNLDSSANVKSPRSAAPPLGKSAAASVPSKPPAEQVEKAAAGAPVLTTLPESYMENDLTVLTVGPDRIVVYWDVNPETARFHSSGRWELVVIIDEIEERISVVGGARNWHIQRPGASNWTEIRFGPVGELGEEPPIARLTQNPPAPAEGVEWGTALDVNSAYEETRLEPALPEPMPQANMYAPAPGAPSSFPPMQYNESESQPLSSDADPVPRGKMAP